MNVPPCFGTYGNRICNSLFCNCRKLCETCYWEYYDKQKYGDRINLREVISKYIQKFNLRIREYSERKK